jgi:hypothetical protein
MKTNKLTQKLGLALLLAGAGITAIADPVVFNVDMSVQIAKSRFNPGNGDVVQVVGVQSDWGTSFTMAPSATNANVYTVTNDLSALSWFNYQFVVEPSGQSWYWETVSAGHRWFQVPTGGTNLPTMFFSDDTNLPSGSVSITFSVDMNSAVQLGNFTIGSDYVNAFGSFGNWGNSGDPGLLLYNVEGTTIYTNTLVTSTLSAGATVNYKYAIDGSGGTWEGNVGPGGSQNRTFTVSGSTTNLPQDYWNNLANATNSYNVTFTANLTAQTALGKFTPDVDSVYVCGDWNWSGSAVQLVQSGSNTNVYTNTVAMVFALGSTVNYKFTLNGGLVWENNGVGPGGADNHQFVLPGNTNLPPNYFNNVADLGPLAISNSGPQTVLYWPSGTNVNNRIRLQNASNLTGTWTDVSDAMGQSSITNNFGSGPNYFRLIGP